MFGAPGFALKSSISLFNRNPAPVTTWPFPYPPFERRRRADGVALGIDDRVVGGLGGFEVLRAGPAPRRCSVVARVSIDRGAKARRVRLGDEAGDRAP